MSSDSIAAGDPHDQFPSGFFDRVDESPDGLFYEHERLVTHIADAAIAAVGDLYAELGINGDVLDLMSSWISHFRSPPKSLTVLGMNQRELESNPMTTSVTVHDLNADAVLPFGDEAFDDVVCCVSIDYLTRPIDVLSDVRRVLRPGGRCICTFSNRCFPTKAIRGWLMLDESQRIGLVSLYFGLAGGFDRAVTDVRLDGRTGDPLFGVWAQVTPEPSPHLEVP